MSQFVAHLQDVFRLLGPVTARRMFGGHGLYLDGLMFALVAQDTLYLKADADNLGHFLQAGLGPFEYEREGKLTRLSYHRAPDELMDDRHVAALWGRRSLDAALRTRQATAAKKAKAPKTATGAAGSKVRHSP